MANVIMSQSSKVKQRIRHPKKAKNTSRPTKKNQPLVNLASPTANKRSSFTGHGAGLLNKMFGSGSNSGSSNSNNNSSASTPAKTDSDGDTAMKSPSAQSPPPSSSIDTSVNADRTSPERKPQTDGVSPASPSTPTGGVEQKKRRSSSVAKAKEIFSSAKNAFQPNNHNTPVEKGAGQTPMQKLSKADPALGVPQGSHNNSAGESMPGPRSTFRVGVTEDKNKKCRRTMEDTHAYLYNFLSTPAQAAALDKVSTSDSTSKTSSHSNSDLSEKGVAETDNGYFAIFDGHAGTFAADWCGKKLHHILEDIIRKNPNTPIPELLDQTFTSVDAQLEKLPLKNSGCTAVTAVLRWEDRVPNSSSATGSTYLNTAAVKGVASSGDGADAGEKKSGEEVISNATRQRVLYTANVGDARIVLCRNGRALRLSYDHKGSDEQEGRRVANAGGLILNNRVNGVLAVTRALGDAYMKDLVTGHPYTTETVIQPDQDEFLILACDGLWDVCSDQEAVDLIRQTQDPQLASKQLVDHALARFSTDNLSCMVIRFDNTALRNQRAAHNIGVEGDPETLKGTMSEADAIVRSVEKLQEEGMVVDMTPNAKDEREAEVIREEQEEAKEKQGEEAPELKTGPLEAAKAKAEMGKEEVGGSGSGS